jgi:hypothetical protein
MRAAVVRGESRTVSPLMIQAFPGIDNPKRMVRIVLNRVFVMQLACDHPRTEVLVRRNGIDYVECKDCRQIFEAEDLEPAVNEEEED